MLNNLILLTQAVPGGRVFGLDAQTLTDIMIQLLNGVILAAAMSWLLYKPVKNFMQERTKRIQGQIDDSNETMDEAQKLISEYDAKISDIEAERVDILDDARAQARSEREAIEAETRKEVEALKRRSQESLQADKDRLQDETRIHIIDAATLIAEKYMSESLTKEDHEHYFDQALANLEESEWQR